MRPPGGQGWQGRHYLVSAWLTPAPTVITTPLSKAGQLQQHSEDSLVRSFQLALQTIGLISTTDSAAGASIAWAYALGNCSWPAGLLALAFVIWQLQRRNGGSER